VEVLARSVGLSRCGGYFFITGRTTRGNYFNRPTILLIQGCPRCGGAVYEAEKLTVKEEVRQKVILSTVHEKTRFENEGAATADFSVWKEN
jgi:hypothetical protein